MFHLTDLKDDGVYKVRVLSHGEHVVQVPCILTGYVRRFVETDEKNNVVGITYKKI